MGHPLSQWQHPNRRGRTYFPSRKIQKFQKIPKSTKISVTSDSRKSRYPKVRLWHSSVSAPSARQHVSTCPTMPALPHDRSGASLGKSKISDFEIFVVRFGSYFPFLALGGKPQISTEFPRKYRFLTSTRAGNGRGGHEVAQRASPVGLCCHKTHCTGRNLENHEKSSKITQISKMIQNVVWSHLTPAKTNFGWFNGLVQV